MDFTPILRSFLRFSPRCDDMLEKMLIGMAKWSEGASPVSIGILSDLANSDSGLFHH